MSRRAAKVDGNQTRIVAALRAVGATVQHLHTVGRGCPDLLVGHRGHNFLVEVKDGTKAPSRQRLTPDEERWHQTWRGQVHVVRSVMEALELVRGGA